MRVCTSLVVGFSVVLVCTSCVSAGRDVRVSLAEYDAFLQSLPKSEISSIDLARQEYGVRFLDEPQRARDDAFLSFRRHYYVVLEAVNDDLYGGDGLDADLGPVYAKLNQEGFTALLRRNGLVSLESEGYPYLGESEDFLFASFAGYVSSPLKRFLEIRRHELGEQFQEDGALRVTFMEVAERCVTWEQYLRRHRASLLEDEALHYYDLYLSALLTGTNNTRVLESEAVYVDSVFVNEIQEAYDFLLEQHPRSRTAEILRPYYGLVKASGFVRNDEVLWFLEDQGIEHMMASRCPTR